jgi:hypothetical protein
MPSLATSAHDSPIFCMARWPVGPVLENKAVHRGLQRGVQHARLVEWSPFAAGGQGGESINCPARLRKAGLPVASASCAVTPI